MSIGSAYSESGEFAFFIDQTKQKGGPILELASGAARVLMVLAKANFRVVGLEASSAMLCLAKKAIARLSWQEQDNIKLVQGDMCNFHFTRPFPLIIVPFASFWFNFERCANNEKSVVKSADQCLECIMNNLAQQGRFIIDASHCTYYGYKFWEEKAGRFGFNFQVVKPYRNLISGDYYGDVLVADKIS